MADKSYEVHGEAIIDGNASDGIAVVLYNSGSVDVRALGTKEFLHVTDLHITMESSGKDYSVVADSKAAGRYLAYGQSYAAMIIDIHLSKPYVCPRGKGLVFFGSNDKMSACIIEGFITEA